MQRNKDSVRPSTPPSDRALTKPVASDDLWELVEEARFEVLRSAVPPPGSFTSRQYAERFGIAVRTAREQLARLVEAGKIARLKLSSGTYYIPSEGD